MVQGAVFRAENINGPVWVSIFGQGTCAIDQLDRHGRATEGDDPLQVIDANQGNVIVDALGVGDKVTGTFIALAGVEHRVDAVAASGAHHRTDVLR
ncbi:hypothetical protein D9M73_187850 [compost metagenome]